MRDLKSLKNKTRYCGNAHADLRNLMVNLEHLSPPAHYMGALQVIMNWLIDETGKVAAMEAMKAKEGD